MIKKKQLLSLLLSVILILEILPLSARAETIHATVADIKEGDFITFGTFNEHPLLWRVIANSNGQIKLFCAEVLFSGEIDKSMHEVLAYANLVSGAWEGDSNWHTSDIRTYLNSDEENVSYKGASVNELPSYSARAGFLTNFSESELNILQEITHKSHTQYHRTLTDRDGGTGFARIEAFPNIIDYDEESYENILSYLNVTERVFLPDAKDLKEANGALNESYLMEFAYNDITDRYYAPSYRDDFWLREPVIYGSSYLFWGMYFLDTTECGYATFRRGIRPMCYIQPESTQALSGEGTLDSPYSLNWGSDTPGSTAPLQLLSRSPENGGVFSDYALTVSMTFNHEVESVQTGFSLDEDGQIVSYGNFSIIREIENADGWSFETVYSLSEGNRKDTDVTVDGCTVTITASSARLIPGETYYVLMDSGVISFKDTDEQIGFSGKEWGFVYTPANASNGFTLGKHNNSFSNANGWESSGFAGINRHTLSSEMHEKLFSLSDPLEKIRLTLYMNTEKWAGSCHGIASTMLLAYENQLDLSQIEDTVNFYYDMSRPCENGQLLDIIEYFQLAQRIIKRSHADNSKISEFFLALLSELNSNPVVLGYSTDAYGHAILALAYTKNKNGDYLVWLYDENSWYDDSCLGRFTTLQIASDFSDYSLTTPDGVILGKDDLTSLCFSTIADVNAINPYTTAKAQSTDESSYSLTQDAAETVLVEIPMSAQSYTIVNAEGETLLLDETGRISGTMEILDLNTFVSEDANGNDNSRWEITVSHSDRFSLATDETAVDITFFTENGCLGLVSDDVQKATFQTNEGITIEAPAKQEEYEFSAYLSHDMIEDNNVRIINASATAKGQTTISVNKNHVVMSAESITGKELTLIDGLTKKKLADLNDADSVIELPKKVEEDIVRPTPAPVGPKPVTPAEPEQPVLPENPFTDVPEGSFYHDAILWAVEKGIIVDVESGVFNPEQSCTRGDMVTFMWRAAGSPEPLGKENPFTDVAEGDYYYKAVLWAVENGITKGTSASTFSPFTTCTRSQTVTFLHRFAGCPAVSGTNPFTDVAEGSYYYHAVLWAVENGITKGTGAAAFSPEMLCSRGQIITFLYRCMEL